MFMNENEWNVQDKCTEIRKKKNVSECKTSKSILQSILSTIHPWKYSVKTVFMVRPEPWTYRHTAMTNHFLSLKNKHQQVILCFQN
jgi:hypothetical protein